MKATVLFVAALTLAGLWQKITRPTSSSAAGARGVTAFERQQPADAVSEFRTAAALDPSPHNHFNLGTAQIAAGARAEGATTIARAMADPALRHRALFNRGNSALASNAFDHAIRDYAEALRLAPGDRDAKRNLEIALQRQKSMQQPQQGGGSRQQQGASQNPQPSPQPAPDRGKEEEGEADAEALLRSVQQQEQEELARMKRSRGDSRRVGW